MKHAVALGTLYIFALLSAACSPPTPTPGQLSLEEIETLVIATMQAEGEATAAARLSIDARNTVVAELHTTIPPSPSITTFTSTPTASSTATETATLDPFATATGTATLVPSATPTETSVPLTPSHTPTLDPAQVTVEDITEIEGTGLTFTVTLDNDVQGSFNVDVTLADVTATGGAVPLVSPEDYDNVVAALVFAGTAGETQQFTVATLVDAQTESAETFTVSIDADNILVDDSDTATGTITNTEPAAVTVEDVSVVEGGGLTFTVTLNNSVSPFAVSLTLQEITLVGGAPVIIWPENYDNSMQFGPLNFAGAAGETQQFTLFTYDNAVVQEGLTIRILLDASDPAINDTDTAIGTMLDND